MNGTSQNPQPNQNIRSPLSPRDLSAVLIYSFRRSYSLPLFPFALRDKEYLCLESIKAMPCCDNLLKLGLLEVRRGLFSLNSNPSYRHSDYATIIIEKQSRFDNYSSLIAVFSEPK